MCQDARLLHWLDEAAVSISIVQQWAEPAAACCPSKAAPPTGRLEKGGPQPPNLMHMSQMHLYYIHPYLRYFRQVRLLHSLVQARRRVHFFFTYTSVGGLYEEGGAGSSLRGQPRLFLCSTI